ncbi:FTR1 family protein [Patulibacter sp. NPDC049589]|uniref:FTR1 family iron permease n=1 Tax=Patulibacter sp. NPDC049589 TaxID=3154731 RepID=UPI00342915F3
MALPQPQVDTRPTRWPRGLTWALLLTAVAGLVYLMATASTGPVDPTEAARGTQSHGTVVVNAAIIVFREGLEAVLIFAAVIASFQGANLRRRRPVVAGAAAAFGASIITWFVAQAVLDAASSLGPKLEAITGFLAIVVLLIVLNWFVHKVYWSQWIGKHHRQRRKLLASSGIGATVGLVALGFTSVYREGFEVVLFLQNLQLQDGTGTVLEGVGIGLAGTALVGVAIFKLHQKLPYRRMLLLTGVLVGFVLMVMIGGTALTFQDLGWIPRHDTPFTVPEWMGAWFEMYSTWETLGAQVLAGLFVAGSYYLAEWMKTRSRHARSEGAATRATAPPLELAER